MFKFDIIESYDKGICNQFVIFLKKKMNQLQESKDSSKNQNNDVFIVGKGREEISLGGAYLQKRGLPDIQEDLREIVTALPPYDYVWECSDIYFEIPNRCPGSVEPKWDYYSRSFYRGLYEEFIEFGKMKGISFIIMKLPHETYLSTKEFGLWPYVVELRPDSSPDGLFHGILPLTGSQCDAYQKIERS